MASQRTRRAPAALKKWRTLDSNGGLAYEDLSADHEVASITGSGYSDTPSGGGGGGTDTDYPPESETDYPPESETDYPPESETDYPPESETDYPPESETDCTRTPTELESESDWSFCEKDQQQIFEFFKPTHHFDGRHLHVDPPHLDGRHLHVDPHHVDGHHHVDPHRVDDRHLHADTLATDKFVVHKVSPRDRLRMLKKEVQGRVRARQQQPQGSESLTPLGRTRLLANGYSVSDKDLLTSDSDVSMARHYDVGDATTTCSLDTDNVTATRHYDTDDVNDGSHDRSTSDVDCVPDNIVDPLDMHTSTLVDSLHAQITSQHQRFRHETSAKTHLKEGDVKSHKRNVLFGSSKQLSLNTDKVDNSATDTAAAAVQTANAQSPTGTKERSPNYVGCISYAQVSDTSFRRSSDEAMLTKHDQVPAGLLFIPAGSGAVMTSSTPKPKSAERNRLFDRSKSKSVHKLTESKPSSTSSFDRTKSKSVHRLSDAKKQQKFEPISRSKALGESSRVASASRTSLRSKSVLDLTSEERVERQERLTRLRRQKRLENMHQRSLTFDATLRTGYDSDHLDLVKSKSRSSWGGSVASERHVCARVGATRVGADVLGLVPQEWGQMS